MRKSLGDKRREISDTQRAQIVDRYLAYTEGGRVKIYDNADFGFRKITVERPLRIEVRVIRNG